MENIKKKKKQGSKLANWEKGGSQKGIKRKTCVGINVMGIIYEEELKLLKETSLHSWGKPSTLNGDSWRDRLLIGGSLL